MLSSSCRYSFVAACLVLALGCSSPPAETRDAGTGGDAEPLDACTACQPRSVVSGHATYEDLVPAPEGLPLTGPSSPIRRALVRLVDGAGAVLATGATDDEGSYSLEVSGALPTDAALEVEATHRSATLEAHVVTTADAPYVLRVPVSAAGVIDAHASADPASGRLAGPFNILDRVLLADDFVHALDGGAVLPVFVVRWELGGSEGTDATLPEASAFGDACVVRLLGRVDVDDDAFDDTVISHELGHCLDIAFSSFSPPPWRGHGADIGIDPSLALTEGVATFLGLSMSGTPLYVDTRGPSDGFAADLESPDAIELGLDGEFAVAAALWDLVDAPMPDDDPFSIPLSMFWSVLTEDIHDGEYKSVHTYLDAFVARGFATDAELDAAFGARFELHRPADPTYPLVMLVPGTPVLETVDATVGSHLDVRPRSAAMDHFGITLSARTHVVLTLTITDTTSDIDLYLQDADRRGITMAATTGPGDVIDTTLDPGNYVLVAWAYGDVDPAARYELVLTTP